MITIKLNIDTIEDEKFVLNKQRDYSHAFRKLYSNYNKIKDRSYCYSIRDEFNLSVYELNCLKKDVKTKYNQVLTNKVRTENDIIDIEKEISELKHKNNLAKKERRKLFKLNKKLVYKNKSLSKDITFGGLSLLRQISFLNNNKEENKGLISQKKKQYGEKRILPLYYIGSLNDSNSNRYFDFDFENKQIVYKPSKNKKIKLTYKLSSKKYNNYLKNLDKVKDSKLLPITIRLTTKHIFITFDPVLLTNYSLNKKELYRELNKIPQEDKKLRKEVAKKFIKEKEERMMVDKLSERYASIDLNPQYIGFSIIDKRGFKIIHKQTYDLSLLTKKNNKSSDDKSTIYLNNKRKHEISSIYKDIFNKVKHYKCFNFVIEDLNFKSPNINENYREFNRKTKNIWNLNFQLNLIKKYCDNDGLKLIEVNPVYSSFIGNILYKDFDAVSASIEICRRGMIKYEKSNSLFPCLTRTILDTVLERFKSSLSDVQVIKDCKTWKELHKLLRDTGCKYRRLLDDIEFNSLSHKHISSRINIIRT